METTIEHKKHEENPVVLTLKDIENYASTHRMGPICFERLKKIIEKGGLLKRILTEEKSFTGELREIIPFPAKTYKFVLDYGRTAHLEPCSKDQRVRYTLPVDYDQRISEFIEVLNTFYSYNTSWSSSNIYDRYSGTKISEKEANLLKNERMRKLAEHMPRINLSEKILCYGTLGILYIPYQIAEGFSPLPGDKIRRSLHHLEVRASIADRCLSNIREGKSRS